MSKRVRAKSVPNIGVVSIRAIILYVCVIFSLSKFNVWNKRIGLAKVNIFINI